MEEIKHEKQVPKKIEEYILLDSNSEKAEKLMIYRFKNPTTEGDLRFNIFEKLLKPDISKKIERVFLDHKIDLLQIEENRDFDLEIKTTDSEIQTKYNTFQFILRKMKESLLDPTLFNVKKKDAIVKNYISKLDEAKTVEELISLSMKFFSAEDKLDSDIDFSTVINRILKKFDAESITKIKILLSIISMNYNKKFNQFFDLNNKVTKAYKELDIPEGVLNKANVLYSNQFFQASSLEETDSEDDLLSSDKNTILIFSLLTINVTDYTCNFYKIPDKKEILFCPFTKFRVTNIKKESEKQFIYLEELPDNYFIDFISSFLTSSYKDNSKLYQKLSLYYQGSHQTIAMTLGENAQETVNEALRCEKFFAKVKDYNASIGFAQKCLRLKIIEDKGISPFIAELYSRIGDYLLHLGKDYALEFYENALKQIHEIFGDNHLNTAIIYWKIGNLYFKRKRDFEKSLTYFEKSMEIVTNLYTTDSIYLARMNKQIGDLYRIKGQSKTSESITNLSEKYYKNSLSIFTNLFGENNIQVSNIYFCLAFLYKGKDQEKTNEYLQKAQEAVILKYKEVSKENALQYIRSGDLYVSIDYEIALEYYKKATATMSSIYGEDSAYLFEFYTHIGQSLYKYSKRESLKNLSKELINYVEKNNEKIGLSKKYNEIGDGFMALGNYKFAYEFFKESRRIIKKTISDSSYEYAVQLEIEANCLSRMSEYKGEEAYKKANRLLDKSLMIKGNLISKDNYELSKIATLMQTICENNEAFAEALIYADMALQINIKLFKENSVETIETYLAISNIFKNLKNKKDFTENLEKAIECRKKIFGENCLIIANDLEKLALGYEDSLIEKRSDCFERRIKIISYIYPPKSVKLMQEFDNLGKYYSKLAFTIYSKKTSEYYNKSREIKIFLYGEHSNEVAISHKTLKDFFFLNKDFKNAIVSFLEYIRILKIIHGDESQEIADEYIELGKLYMETSENLEAEKYFQKSLDINLKLENQKKIEFLYMQFADFYKITKKEKKAIEFYQKAKEIKIQLYGEKNPDAGVANVLNLIGNCYHETKQILKATEYFQESLKTTIDIYGKKNVNTLKQYNKIFEFYKDLNKFQFAIEVAEKMLSVKKCTEKSSDIANHYNTIAMIYKKQKEYYFAFENLNNSLKIKLELYGEDSLEVANQYNEIWDCYADLGDFKKSKEYYKKALKIKKKIGKKADVADQYIRIGDYYKDNKKDTLRAEKFYEKALSLKIQCFGEFSIQIAKDYREMAKKYENENTNKTLYYYKKYIQCWRNSADQSEFKFHRQVEGYLMRAEFLRTKKNFKPSLKSYEKALGIQKLLTSEKSKEVAALYENIAFCYKGIEDGIKAIEYYDASLKIKKEIYNEESIEVADVYILIGDSRRDMDEVEKSHSDYKKALEIQTLKLGEDNIKIAETYIKIGVVLEKNFQYNDALECFKKATAIFDRASGNKNDIALSYNNIGRIFYKRCEYDMSILEHNRTLALLKNQYFNECDESIAVTYNYLGLNYLAKCDYTKALDNFEKSLKIRKKLFGDSSLEIADSSNHLGALYEKLMDNSKCWEKYEKSLKIYLSIKGDNDIETAKGYLNLGNVYMNMEQFDESYEFFQKALKIYNHKKGLKNMFVSEVYKSLGMWSRKVDLKEGKNNSGEQEKRHGEKKAETLKYYDIARDICRDKYGFNHVTYTDIQLLRAEFYIELKEYNNALIHLEDVYKNYEKLFPIDPIFDEKYSKFAHKNIRYGNLFLSFGKVYFLTRNFCKSEEYIKKAEEIFHDNFGNDCVQIIECYDIFGKIKKEKAKEATTPIQMEQYYLAAIQNFEDIFKIRTKIYGSTHYLISCSHFEIGKVFKRMNKYSKSLEYFTKAKKIREKTLGKTHILTSDLYNSIGKIHKIKKNFNEALDHFIKSLGIRETYSLLMNTKTGKLYKNIAEINFEKKNYEEALKYFESALEVFRKIKKGENSLNEAIILNLMGEIYDCQTEYEFALEHLRKALEIFKRKKGEKHILTADCLSNIAQIHKTRGEYTLALNIYFKVENIHSEILQKEDLKRIRNLDNIGITAYNLGNYGVAIEYFTETLKNYYTFLKATKVEYGLYESIYFSMYTISQAFLDTPKLNDYIKNEIKEDHLTMAKCYLYLSSVYFKMGEFDKANKFDYILKNYIETLNKNDFSTSIICFIIGRVYDDYNTIKALQYYENALILFYKQNKKNNIYSVNSYMCLAEIYFKSNDYVKTMENYLRALKINIKIFGEQDEVTKKIYHKMGTVYIELGEHAKGMELIQKSREI